MRKMQAPQKFSTYYTVPTLGQTVVVPTFDGPNMRVLLDPAGTLATLTVTLPSATDGQSVAIMTSQALTLLTLNGGTIINTVTTLALGNSAEYIYSVSSNKWFRLK